MPKEKISRTTPVEMPEAGGVFTSDDGVYISMHWTSGQSRSHDGDIQIALDVDISTLKQMIHDHMQGIHYSDTDHPDRVLLFSNPMNRDEVQRLIRTARRARDNSFGADE